MQNHFTIAINTFNHEKWIERCLSSCLTQKYDNFDVILVDAISTDNNFNIINKIASENKKLKVYQNEIRIPQIANFVFLAEKSKDNTIIIFVDGDDWLANSKVLQKLNDVYNSGEVWMTYGKYTEYHGEGKPYRDVSFHYGAYPEDVIEKNSFREYKWLASHLRTMRKELFFKISIEDYKRDGKWFDYTGDQALMLPALELSGKKSRFIDEVLYIYNVSNPSRDGATSEAKQIELANYIRAKEKYKPIEKLS